MAESAGLNGNLSKLYRWWGIWVVGGVDHDAILKEISAESGWTGRYVFLILISAAISMLGLLMPSVAVLIGAMLLSPLMMPIIGLGFGIATLDFQEIRRAATALALGLAAPGLLLAATPVNINKADARAIAKSLDGIGATRAEAIVAWREAHGPFKKADDLKHVKGIGKATI